MSDQHTPGQLHIAGRETRGLPHTLVAARTLLFRVYSEAYGDFDQETANARRLVACWNACQGISTMDLELDNVQFVAQLKERLAFKAQRDELLETLLQIVDGARNPRFDAYAHARKAVAKHTGGTPV